MAEAVSLNICWRDFINRPILRPKKEPEKIRIEVSCEPNADERMLAGAVTVLVVMFRDFVAEQLLKERECAKAAPKG